jgi:heme-degrading monooxygenase HmoA
MFIAMNRFRVAKGSEAAFENVWRSRDSHLEKVPGFVEFHLRKGPEAEDHLNWFTPSSRDLSYAR